jgi:hypothetical protein
MLDDEDAINDVNPFVSRDFSLPGGVRQTGNFADFQEVPQNVHSFEDEKSVFCNTNACEGEREPCIILKDAHPRRNIDTGFTCGKRPVKVGVSRKQRMSYIGLFFIIFFIALILVYARY